MRFPVAFTRWQQAGAEADNVIALDVVAKSDRWTRLPSAHASTSRVPESQAYPPNHVSTQRRGLPGPRLQGWRVGAVSSATIGIITLMINIIAVAMLRHHSNDEDSLVELFRGNCDKVETMHIWSHFLINIIGTLLLSGSNYCMQVLAAPTRHDIDRWHARGRWLDIGVPSARNVFRIAPLRILLWWTLALSSIPLHLLYNSAFYASIGVNDYRIDVVTRDFLDIDPVDLDTKIIVPPEKVLGPPSLVNKVNTPRLDDIPDTCSGEPACRQDVGDLLRALQVAKSPMMSKEDCIREWGTSFLTDRSNLVLVSSNSTNDSSVVISDHSYRFGNAVNVLYTTYRPFEWICSSSERMVAQFGELSEEPLERSSDADHKRRPCEAWVSEIQNNVDKWTPMDLDIDGCIGEPVEQRCSFSGNISILIVVIVCNFVKICCMLYVAFGLDEDLPLITIGDAMSSFLQNPDPYTKGCCLWSREDALQTYQRKPFLSRLDARPKIAGSHRRQWKKAASRGRWFCTFMLVSLAISITLCLFGAGYSQIKRHNTPINALGFGKINASALVNGWSIVQIKDPRQQILSAILVANFPQTVLSFLYLHLNGLVTSFWVSVEWLSYSTNRKPLRVSRPAGDQRMTFFLQLPYKVGMPLMLMSGILHWLVSQSFFLAVVAEYDWQGKLINPTAIATCGYSLVPMMAVMGIGVAIIIGLVLVGWYRKLDRDGHTSVRMPLAGSCSAAISAACHRPEWDTGAETKPLMWGAVRQSLSTEHNAGEEVGHCCFTSGPVEPLVEGRKYA